MEQVISAPVKELRLSPLNYRTKLGPPEKFAQLCSSVAAKGVLQPITVRPVKGAKGHEVVFGNRRFAAAQKAGLDTILAVVRDIPDADVLELQVIENAEREDPSPLEEARAFERLMKDHGRTVDQLADRINRTPTYVAQRLKLLTLSKAVRQALEDNKITLAIATLIARVPDAKLQDEALDAIQDGADYTGQPMKADEARKLLEERFLLRLEGAAFDTTSAELVPKVGACTTCPKRTGQQRALFPDVKSPDLCTDPVCFRGKLDAVWKIRIKEAKTGGQAVLDGKEAERALGYGGSYRKLDGDEWIGNKKKTVRQILGKNLPPVALVRDDAGNIHQVVRSADVRKVLEKDAPKTGARASARESDYEAKRKADERKQKLRRKAISLAIAAAIEKATKLAPIDVLELVVRAFAARVWNEVQRAILDGRGIEAKGGDVERAVLKLAKDCGQTNGDTLGLALELAMRSGAPLHGGMSAGVSEIWRDALQLAGIDFVQLEKQVAAEAKEKAKPKAKGRKAPIEKPAHNPAKISRAMRELAGCDPEFERECRVCGCTDLEACEGGCTWAEDDLCSKCVGKEKPKKASNKKPAKAKKKGGRK